jgi:hypothetical protein
MGADLVGVVVVGAIAAAGCGSDTSAETPTTPIAISVSEATWTDGPWPLTAAEGVLRCRFSYQVTFTAKGQEYALNRKAVESSNFANIEAIARPRSEGSVGYVEINGERLPVSVGPDTGRLITRGLDLCS